MSNKFSWEENNRSYAEAMVALEAKGDGKCYCPCNDCRGLQTRKFYEHQLKNIVRRRGMLKRGMNIIHW